MHPSIQHGSVAVVTGGASGIGLAAARHLARAGMKLCLVDLGLDRLAAARHQVLDMAETDVQIVNCDLANASHIKTLADEVYARFGAVNLVLNNAGIQPGSSIFDTEGTWDRILGVNMMGIIRTAQIFGQRMIQGGQPGLIINTGSKQGITTPPGDPAYNVSKAGVKVFTEALQHHLRGIDGCLVEARLFIPGFVYTPLTAQGRSEKPSGAWTPEQVVDFLFERLSHSDFYILCPDNDVDRETDIKRIAWAAGDIIHNRPPLSRWHPDFQAPFQEWLKS